MAEEEITRAGSSTTQKRKTTGTTQKRKTTSTTTNSRRKTTSASAKKPSTSAKKPSTSTAAKKKTTTSTSIRLTKEEKTLVTNFRKCNMIEKKVITLLASKLSDSTTRTPEEDTQLSGLMRMLGGDQ